MALITRIEQAQAQTLDTLVSTQQRVLSANDKFAGAVKDRVPAVKVPLAGLLPTPAEGVKLYFEFAGKLLSANRIFAERAVAAWAETVPAPAKAKAAASRGARPRVAKAA